MYQKLGELKSRNTIVQTRIVIICPLFHACEKGSKFSSLGCKLKVPIEKSRKGPERSKQQCPLMTIETGGKSLASE